MADYLINFAPGEEIKASETNSNNQFLLDKISDNTENIQNYVSEQLGTMQSNISSIQKTLQQNIDQLSEQITNLQNAKFTPKHFNLVVGNNNLSSYLPNNNKQYLVWVNAHVWQKSGNGTYISTDIMPEQLILLLDGDSGRQSADSCLCVVPVGADRRISLRGPIQAANICGYCKI